MIVIADLTFYYEDELVLKNLNFNIKPNSWISIIGHNGSGKSTFAKILLGLLKPSKGYIAINNILVNETNLPFLRPKIAMILQNPDYQFTGLTVKEDIAFGLENYNVPRNKMFSQILKYTKILGIQHLLDCDVTQLSGGQKQRVAIASILVLEPDIIVFDEVTAFLDPQGALEIENIIAQIKNKTLITITHDLKFAAKSDEIILLDQGKLIKKATPQVFFQNEAFLNKYNLQPFLSLKLYYQMEADSRSHSHSQHQNKPMLTKLKDALWEYNLKK
ncbi:ATP-binding cassette domain-containing protein ['Fragaria x ananassa' phyllody phytoplasma]|uniref:ATP-binding cassette domain-containing protein n=1 Tax='Fragaria x ananassa' phyllody phytoplasma TaxID=2358428 RepID=A0ABS5K4N2_9MOLU|nr:ATP-binding cassette domain-containing protein ['Fragaria x ananassa' phyllody phytoplasma]MBS2126230.1 ATP-binding cassette domain-containing protein ['Fragaria x ananassa' phyllody phytoplasma]